MRVENVYSRIWRELGKKQMRYYYFLWKNGLSNSRTDFTQYSQEEFINKYCDSSKIKFKNLEMWETSEQYQRLQNELLQSRINSDINRIYDVVVEKALKGDEKAVKTLLLIKKELDATPKKKQVQAPKQEQEEDIEFDLN
ncbi:hypothetical protein [Clostridium ganghwense]|uniref:Phage portal protein n=1 Tax=Clostridium ganghwense TaxID=312089 RepID=A0ABT4CUP7_9CLOT|nr:hypothetical protein [Clostridium ganghwense]MCY6372757.1 hypothetical protein [Clostridium ganghwense]